MNSTRSIIEKIIIRTISAYIVCLALGFIFFRNGIFIFHHSTFQFVAFGAIGAIFLGCLRSLKRQYAIIVFVILCIIEIGFIQKIPGFSWDLRDILYLSALGFSIYFYWRYPYKFEYAPIVKSLQIAFYLTIANMFALFLLIVYNNAYKEFGQQLINNLLISFLIGLGLGIGTEIGTVLSKHIDKPIHQVDIK